MIATKEFLKRLDEISETRKREILSSEDRVTVTGKTYYVSNMGNDDNDGTAPERAWKTLARVSAAELLPGDGVRFCRGDLFRGFLETREGVTYAAYGTGDKPRFYGWEYDLANPTLWAMRQNRSLIRLCPRRTICTPILRSTTISVKRML